jgi:hypothetical protein
MSETILTKTILSERTNKYLKVMAVHSLSVMSQIDVKFWSLPGPGP